MNQELLDYLLSRKSAPIQTLKKPGPDDGEIATLIRVASRVPDHGKLEPWRFIVYRGEVRATIGRMLAERYAAVLGRPLTPGEREKEEERFSRAPVVIGVVSVPRDNPKIPQWEMFLSAGAAAMNLVHAANAMGFGANWITNWYADDAEARRLLGLSPDERVTGFVHIGTPSEEAPDRPRPDPATIVSEYAGPWGDDG